MNKDITITSIIPSILSAQILNLKDTINELIKFEVKELHIDIMDGHFVPNISFGANLIDAIKKEFPFLILDTHLMVTNPEKLKDLNVDKITFHIKTTHHPFKLIQYLKNIKKKVGIALNPGTSICCIEELLFDIDTVLVMGVNPGFGGQEWIPQTLKTIKKLKTFKLQNNLTYDIRVDGGVNNCNIKQIFDNGANSVVIGSYIFPKDKIESSKDRYKTIIDLLRKCKLS